jgi:hypothetical protein
MKAFEQAFVVFSGTAVKEIESEREIRVVWPDGRVDVSQEPVFGGRFVVDKRWKGDVPNEVKVVSSPGWMCAQPFRRGSRYLVYAYRGPSNELETDACARTKLYEHAAEDIEALEKMSEIPKR